MDEIVGSAAKKYLDCQCLFFLDEINDPTAKFIWIFNAWFFFGSALTCADVPSEADRSYFS